MRKWPDKKSYHVRPSTGNNKQTIAIHSPLIMLFMSMDPRLRIITEPDGVALNSALTNSCLIEDARSDNV